jgi:phage-related protein
VKHTKNSYTSDSDIDKVSAEQENSPDLEPIWEGNSHDVIRTFPEGPRANIGGDLRKVQRGLPPADSGAVPGVRSAGVFELRDRDADTWYRLIYKVIGPHVYILHCYTKQSNQIEKRDIRTIEQRLANLNRRLKEEARDAKRQARAGGAHYKRKRSG